MQGRRAADTLDGGALDKLKRRVDIVPPSLALAQAAEESGWGTSRFAIKGNSLFGQWDFSGKGIKPKEQRAELGNYGIAIIILTTVIKLVFWPLSEPSW